MSELFSKSSRKRQKRRLERASEATSRDEDDDIVSAPKLSSTNRRKKAKDNSSSSSSSPASVFTSTRTSTSTSTSLKGNKWEANGDETSTIHDDDVSSGVHVHVHTNADLPSWSTFDDLGLDEMLVKTCRSLGFQRPTPVQQAIVPFLISQTAAHVLALAATGSGKTAAFCLPILHHLAKDPYGIYAAIISPTRELAKQIHQQVLALGSAFQVRSALVVGGLDPVQQACELDKKPHFIVATPGRLAELLRGPSPPRLKHIRFLVLDEADRLLTPNSGFERDVAELVLHCNRKKRTVCQTLLFSATMTGSLEMLESIAGTGQGRLPLHKFLVTDSDPDPSALQGKGMEAGQLQNSSDGGSETDSKTNKDNNDKTAMEAATTPRIPAGLKQEYLFMPSRVRDAYLLATIRALMSHGGRAKASNGKNAWSGKRSRTSNNRGNDNDDNGDSDGDGDQGPSKSRSAIIFVSTCERAALVSGILSQVGVENVALHSLLSQNRRLAALGKFKSQQARVLVATDVASRGLDIPCVDLVINSELPRNTVSYVHRVGRTARAGRRGRAISLVAETDVNLVHAAERITGRPLEKCTEIPDDAAIKMLGPVTKAARLAKMHLMDIGFDDLVKKFKERKVRDRKERQRIEKALRRSAKRNSKSMNKSDGA